jgi:predicted outer membrane repeat protein
MIRSVLMSALLAAGLVGSATAETITVCAKGCDYTSINAAIDASSNGDVIQLAAETYFEGEQIDTDGKAITLRGVLDKAGEPASVLDGSGTHRVLICENGEGSGTVFDNLVIQNGLASGGFPDNAGGGMYNASNISPTLTNCTFTGNSAETWGGGMSNWSNSSPTLTSCTFTGNSAYDGGGMFNDNSSPTLTDCTFTGNSADRGGGMYNDSSSPTLANCTVTGNSAESKGGGISCRGISELTLMDCNVTENTASEGGGIHITEGWMSVNHSALIGNVANNGSGGSIWSSGEIVAQDCEIAGSSFSFDEDIYVTYVLPDVITNGSVDFRRTQFRGGPTHFAGVTRISDCLFKNGGGDCSYNSGCSCCASSCGRRPVVLGEADVTQCRFEGLSNFGGSPVSCSGTLTSCIFENCRSYGLGYGGGGSGGALLAQPGCVVQFCEFRQNTSEIGGAVVAREATFIGCNFEFNEANGYAGCDTKLPGRGGALFATDSILESCVFTLNQADGGGTAIFGTGNDVVDCLFCSQAETVIDGDWNDGGENDFREICAAGCDGDLDYSGAVDANDLGLWLAGVGDACGPGVCIGDFNEDGEVSGADLGLLLNAWGPCD